MFNMLAINPAYAGSRNVISASTIYRKQWLGIEGSPRTIYGSVDMPLRKQKIGVGLTLINDRIGIVNQMSINAQGAYRVQLTSTGTLAFGLQLGMNQFHADYASLDFSRTNSSNLPDQAFSSSIRQVAPNIGAGLYYTTDRWYLGLSGPKLIRNNFSGAYSSQLDVSSFKNRPSRHYFFIAGYVIKLNEQFRLKPSILTKAIPGAPVQTDINMNLWYIDKISLGLSYRTGDALVSMLEIQATPQLRFGYSYDFPITSLAKVHSGSHEVMIRYEFGYSNANIQSPRYF
jgi:type IX secretion system PorP/SprF family membrane protein